MGDPGNNGDFPSSLQQMAYKLTTGQASDVAKEVGTKLYRDFTAAAQRAGDAIHRTLNQPVAPELPSMLQATYKVVTGQASDVAGDFFERAVWETGQFVTNTTDALKSTLNAPVAPAVPNTAQASFKIMTGQAGEVAGDFFERGVWETGHFVTTATGALMSTLNAPVPPAVPTTLQATYKIATGQAGDLAGDLVERGVWETGQFISNTTEAVKRTVTGPQPPAIGTAEAARMFMTGRASEVASNIAGRALWQTGQFVQHTAESLGGTGAPAETAPATTAPAESTAKAKTPPPGAKL
ncbi:MAG: hypothetical protein ACAH80_17140 [Alphaproteobacteria bacterium]